MSYDVTSDSAVAGEARTAQSGHDQRPSQTRPSWGGPGPGAGETKQSSIPADRQPRLAKLIELKYSSDGRGFEVIVDGEPLPWLISAVWTVDYDGLPMLHCALLAEKIVVGE